MQIYKKNVINEKKRHSIIFFHYPRYFCKKNKKYLYYGQEKRDKEEK